MSAVSRSWMKHYLLSKRFVRYLLVGGLNTLFGFLVYSTFILLHCSTWLALIGGNVAGVVFNFFTIGGLVFLNLSPSRVPLFVLSYVVIYFVNLELIGWVAGLVHGRIMAQAVLVLPMALLSYLILSTYVFKKADGDDRGVGRS
ncbi:MAG TPA: GtrA family protein [Gammaproteobacteria bacterium]|nr:GtrA family protein [Gammaproteobacteria bacterium]